MDLELSQDQTDLRALARELLAARGDLRPARELLEGDGDPGPLLAEMADLGWYAVGLAEDDPFGVTGLCLLAEQIGYRVVPSLLVDAAVGARLAGSGGEQQLALAVLEPTVGWLAELPTTRCDGAALHGTKLAVHHAAAAEGLVVTAALDGARAAFLVAPDAAGCTISPAAGLDPSAGACTVTFDGAPAQLLTRDPDVLRQAFAVGAVATAAEALGAATRALELAVDYARERHQFGRPIGAFQALQHLLADLHVRRETGWSTVLYASAALEEQVEDALSAASVAKAYVSRATREIVEGALQVFGGVGFTWEHDAHLLQRRVLACERRFGDGIDHDRQLMAALDAAAF